VDGDDPAAPDPVRPPPRLEPRPDGPGAEFPGTGFGEKVQDLGLTAAPGATEEAGRENAASVHHEEVALLEQIGERGEVTVPDGAATSIEGQQPRGVPVGERFLRDETGRQVEVEVPGLQKSFF
jgi:hypothetical protein